MLISSITSIDSYTSYLDSLIEERVRERAIPAITPANVHYIYTSLYQLEITHSRREELLLETSRKLFDAITRSDSLRAGINLVPVEVFTRGWLLPILRLYLDKHEQLLARVEHDIYSTSEVALKREFKLNG